MWNSIIYNCVTYNEGKDRDSVRKNKAPYKNIWGRDVNHYKVKLDIL